MRVIFREGLRRMVDKQNAIYWSVALNPERRCYLLEGVVQKRRTILDLLDFDGQIATSRLQQLRAEERLRSEIADRQWNRNSELPVIFLRTWIEISADIGE